MFFAKAGEYKRILLDRTIIYDAMIFFICELNERYNKLDHDQLNYILTYDFGLDIPEQQSPRGIYYDRFRIVLVDNTKKTCSFTVGKSREAIPMIPYLYNIVRKAFTQQGIGNIKDYVSDKTGAKVVKHRNHSYINFPLHFKHRIY
jgi:hypothetical protein